MNEIAEQTELMPGELLEGQAALEPALEEPQPEPEPPVPIRPLAETKADLEKELGRFKAFTEGLESDQKRLEEATREENEILEAGGRVSEEEQLERLTKVLALKKVLERKLERGQESGLASASDQLGAAVKEALRSLWQELALLRARREEKHLVGLKKLVGNETQWGWAEKQARMLMRHFGDLLPLERLGESADFSLSHGAVQLAAEQVLADIGTFEAEKAAKR